MNKEDFYKKVSQEYQDFKNNFLKQSKEEIFENAFEIVVKGYIKDYLMENIELTDEQIEKFDGVDNIIDLIFEYYLENGEYLDFDELCEEGINDVLASLGIIEEEIE